ncbi:glycosyltransferase [Spirosoma daeguense]
MINKLNYLVSVNVITFNHGRFIRECLESILSQKTDFLYEIVICDDFSNDDTRNILEDYKDKFPEIIKLRFRNKNLGLKYNYFDNIQACTGKYVAICEGDDYWTSENKLQKQIDILEKNPDYSMCFHSALELHQYDGEESRSNIFSNLQDRTYSGQEILSKWLIPTASVVFRKDVSTNFSFLDKFLFYDIVLFLRLCEYGKLYCLNEVMCVYRRHSKSITNSNLSYKSYINHLLFINMEFQKRYDKLIKELVAIEYFKQARHRFKQKSLSFVIYSLASLSYSIRPFYFIVSSKLKNEKRPF